MQLWTEKHKPATMEEIAGQKKAMMETQDFLNSKVRGKALLFHGPPGVCKTLIAEVAAAERGWLLVEVNASDSRSGKSLEEMLGGTSKQQSLFHRGKLILIDEADGISGRDRGASAVLIKIIKESKFPIILIANDPWNPKLRSLRNYCRLVKFGKVPYPSIAKKLREISEKEGIEADDEVLKNLARWAGGDMRSALMDLQLLSMGRNEIKDSDMESLGFRERERSVFDVLPTIFFSGSLNASRKVMREIGRDPDELFWWLESNLKTAYRSPDSIAGGYDLLAKADMFRAKVLRQQNWRFRAYMSDMMAGVSVFKDERHGFVPFRAPDRLILMGRSKGRRAILKSIGQKAGEKLHCSRSVVMREYMPFFKFLMKKGKQLPDELELAPEELEIIRKY